jgi:hypothetical protein
MNTRGRYCLTYDPRQEYDTEYLEPDIRMSIDCEADLNQMLSFFDAFLKASGYVYDGELQIVKREQPAPYFGKSASTVTLKLHE